MNTSTSYVHVPQITQNKNACNTYLLKTFGLHLSDINTESLEHTNKILKEILVCLQGFAMRAIAKHCTDEVESNTTLNHLGFVMFEHMIKFFHAFDTMLPKKHDTHCGLCDGINHNTHTCTLVCPICMKGYFVRHTHAK